MRLLPIIFVLFAVPSIVYSSGKTWTGGVDSNWSSEGNWAPSGVPASTDDVIIPTSASAATVTMDIAAGTTIASLAMSGSGGNVHTLNLSGNLQISGALSVSSTEIINIGSSDLIIKGDFVVDGVFSTVTGKLIFNGGVVQSLSISSAQSLGDLQVSAPNTVVSLLTSANFKSISVSSGTIFKNATAGTTMTIADAGTITINAGGTFDLTGSGSNIVFQPASGTFSLNAVSGSTVNLSYASIKDCNAGSGAEINAQNNCVDLGGNTNIDFYAPSAIADLVANTGSGIGTITLTWAAVGDDTTTGTASGYIVKYSGLQIEDEESFNSATTYVQNWTPLNPADTEEKTLTGLFSVEQYYISIKAVDNSGGTGSLSNTDTNSAIASGNLKVWNNDSGGYWADNGNWTPAGAPDAASDVIIPDTVSSCTITMESGDAITIASLTMNGTSGNSHTLFLFKGNLDVEGSLTISSYETMTCASNSLIVKGDMIVNGDIQDVKGVAFNSGLLQSISLSNNQNLGIVALVNTNTSVSLLTSAKFTSISLADRDLMLKSVAAGTTVTIEQSSMVTVSERASFILTGTNGNNIVLSSMTSGSAFSFNTDVGSTVILNYVSIKDCNASGGKKINAQNNCTDLGGNINVDFYPPSAITDLSAGPGGGTGTLSLTWTATGDDTTSGSASSYIVKYSTSLITTQEQFDSANTYTQGWSPFIAGTVENRTMAGLTENTTYYISVKTVDGAGGIGELSNCASAVVGSYGKTWNNASGENWSAADNWSPTGVPILASEVVIPSSISACTVTMDISGGTTIASLTMSGADGNTHTLNLSGNLQVNGQLSISSLETISLGSSDLVLKKNAGIIGTFLKGTGNLCFNGGVVQSFLAGNQHLGKVVVSLENTQAKLSSSAKFTSMFLSSGTSFKNDNAGTTVTIDSGSYVSLDSAQFILTGTSGNNIVLKSSSDDSSFSLVRSTGSAVSLSYAGIKDCSVAGTVEINAQNNCTDLGGNTNIDFYPPSAITDLSAGPGGGTGTLSLTWTATGDDTTSGTAAIYIVKYSPSIITTQSQFNSANTYSQTWAPIGAGLPENRTLTGLVAGATYYTSVKTVDNVGGTGLISNCSSAIASNYKRTWSNAGGGNWSDAGNWNPTGVPVFASDVVIPNISSCTVTMDISGGTTIASLTMNGAGGNTHTLNLSGNLEITGGLTASSVEIINLGSCTASVKGNSIVAGSIGSGAGELALTGSLAQNLSVPNCSANIKISNASTAVTLISNANCKNLTVNSNSVLAIQGNKNIVLSGNLTLDGNIEGTGGLGFNGGVVQSVSVSDSKNKSLGNVQISTAGTVVSLLNGVNFTGITMASGTVFKDEMPGTSVTLDETGAGVSINQGSFLLTGANGNNIILQSSTPGNTFSFFAAAGSTVNLSYVGIQDCNASSSGFEINGGNNCADLTGNTNIDFAPPATISDLEATTGSGNGEINLTWLAVGDDGTSGTATSYIVKYSASQISTESDFNSAITYAQTWIPIEQKGENIEEKTLTGLVPGSLYYISIKAVDNGGAMGGVFPSSKNHATASSSYRSWNNPAGGNWSVDSNWIPTGVPLFSDDVTIPSSISACTITMDITVGTTISSFTMNGTGGNTHTLNLSGNLQVNGNMTISNLETISLGSSDLMIRGNSAINGTLLKGTGSLIFGGFALKTLSAANNQDLGKVVITGSNTVISLINSAKFDSITIISGSTFKDGTAGTTVTMNNGSYVSVINGSFTLTGTSGNNVVWKSASDGTPFRLYRGGGSLSLSYASIKDCSVVSSGEINASDNCVNLGGNTNIDWFAPSAIVDLIANTGPGTGTITLTWTAVGDDTTSGTASGYLVKYSSTPITTEALFTSATSYTQSWTPRGTGLAESKTLIGLTGNATYYLSLKAKDNANPSAYGSLSNSVNAVSGYNLKIWNNSGGGSWSSASNWSPSAVPDSSSDVVIPTSISACAITMDISGGTTILSLTMSGTGGNTHTLNLSGALNISGTMSVSSLETVNLGSCIMSVRGNVSVLGNITSSTGTLLINGTIDQFLSAPNCSANINIQRSSVGGYDLVLLGNTSCKNLYLSGSISLGDYNLYVSENITIGMAAFSFDNSPGYIIFNGGVLQTIASSGGMLLDQPPELPAVTYSMGNVRLSSSNTTLTLGTNNYNFRNLIIDTNTHLMDSDIGTTLTINSTGKVTVGGLFTLAGSGWGNDSVVFSSTGSSAFVLYKQTEGSLDFTYVGLSGCSASNNPALDLSGNLVNNLGGNANIIFPNRTWAGTTLGNWQIVSNWYPPAVPASCDNVIINKVNTIVTNASGRMDSLTIGATDNCTLSFSSNGVITLLGTAGLSVGSSGYLETGGSFISKGNIYSDNSSLLINSLTLNGNSSQTVKWHGKITDTLTVGAADVVLNNSSGATLICKNLTVNGHSTLKVNLQTVKITGDTSFSSSGKLVSTNSTLIFYSPSGLQNIIPDNNNFGNVRVVADSGKSTLNVNSAGGIIFDSLIVNNNAQFRALSSGTTISVNPSDFGITVFSGGAFLCGGDVNAHSVLKTLVDGQTFKFVSIAGSQVSFNYANISYCDAGGGTTIWVPTNCTLENTNNISVSASINAKTWTGSGSNDWNTTGNWIPAGVPDFNNDVFIPTDKTVESANGTINSLTFTGAGRLSLSTSLTINDFCTVSGCTLQGGILNVKGNLSGSSLSSLGLGNLNLTGNTWQSVRWEGQSWNLTLNSSALVTLSNDLSCNNITINGRLYAGSANMGIGGDIFAGSACTCTFDSGNVTAGGNLYLNNSNVNSFVKGTGKLIFNKGSSGTQYLKIGGAYDLGSLNITNNSTVSLTTNARFTLLTIDSGSIFKDTKAGTTLTVTDGGGITVDGVFTLAGTGSATTVLTTSNVTAGSAGFSLKTDTNMLKTSFSYIKIRNCTPVIGSVDATDNCANLGGNDLANIIFSSMGKTWIGSDGDWANSNNWAPAGAVNGASFIVVNTNTAITNVSGAVNSLTLSSPCNLTLSGDLNIRNDLTASFAVTMHSENYSLFIKRNVYAPFLISGSGNLQLVDSSVPVAIVFNGTSWNIQNSNISYPVNMAGGVTCKNLTLDSSSKLSVNSYDLCIKGNAIFNGDLYKGTGNIIFNGGTLQILSGNTLLTANLGNVQINSSGTIVSLLTNLNVSNLILSSTAHLKNIIPGTTISIDSSGNVSVNNSTITFAGNSWGPSSVYWISSGSSRFTLNNSSGTYNLTNVSLTGCSVVGSTLDLSAGSVNNLGNNANLKFQPRTWMGGASTWFASEQWYPPSVPDSLDDIIINASGSNVTKASGVINSLTMGTLSNYCILSDSVSTGLTVLAPSPSGITLGSNGYVTAVSFNVKGNMTSSNISLRLINLALSGNSAQTVSLPNCYISTALNISNTSAMVTLNNSPGTLLYCSSITSSTGSTLKLDYQTVKITTGNAVLSGTVISNPTTTLIFDRNGGMQNLTATNNSLGNVLVQITSSGSTLNLTDSARFYSLNVGDNSVFQSMNSGTTISISPSAGGLTIDGKFMIAGSYDNPSVLKSLTDSSSFKLNVDSQADCMAAYVSFIDCNASVGSAVKIPNNCSTTRCSNFVVDPFINAKTWTWAGSFGSWTSADKWNPDSPPTPLDDIVIPDGKEIDGASGTIASLTFNGSSVLTIPATLTVNGDCTVLFGNVTLKGGTLSVKGNAVAVPGSVFYSSGILNLSGSSLQNLGWQGESWNVVISNTSAAGVSAVSELRCYNFSLTNNAKYNQGESNLYTLGNLTMGSGSNFTIAAANGVSANGNASISGSGYFGSSLLVGGSLSLNSGSNFTISPDGDVTVGTYLVMDGNSTFGNNLYVTQYVSSGGSNNLGAGSVNVNNNFDLTGGTVTESVGSIVVIGGNLSINTGNYVQKSNLTIAGLLSIGTSGSFTQQSGANLSVGGNVSINNTFTQLNGDIYLSGSLINIASGKFNKGTGRLKFVGSIQTLNSNGNDLNRAEIPNLNSTLNLISNVKFSSLLINTGTNLACSTNGQAVTLGNTIVNGTLNFSGSKITLLVTPGTDNGISVSSVGRLRLAGTSGTNYAAFLSAVSGSQFRLTTDNTDNVSLRYSYIRDCNAGSGSEIHGIACIDLGNNSNVLFGAQPPAEINLKIRQVAGSGELRLNWTAVGAEGTQGTASGYIVKYSTVNITTQEQFDSANAYVQSWVPLRSGEAESYVLTGLRGTDIWYASVEAKNFADLQGGIAQISEFTVQVDPNRPVSYSLPGERGNVNIEVPQGAFSQSVEITGRELNSSQMPSVSSQPEFKSTGLGASFTISTSEKIKQPLKLKIKYEAKDIEGLNAEKLRIAFYNDTMGKWYHIKSNVDSANRRVCADLKHLTTFRVVEYTYLGLSTVKVFPNPWKIGKGNSFDSDTLTFKNLPEKGRIRIYNIAGEMVKNINITSLDDGFYSWDGTTDFGKKVSSGVYLAYVEDTEGNHRIIRVAVVK